MGRKPRPQLEPCSCNVAAGWGLGGCFFFVSLFACIGGGGWVHVDSLEVSVPSQPGLPKAHTHVPMCSCVWSCWGGLLFKVHDHGVRGWVGRGVVVDTSAYQCRHPLPGALGLRTQGLRTRNVSGNIKVRWPGTARQRTDQCTAPPPHLRLNWAGRFESPTPRHAQPRTLTTLPQARPATCCCALWYWLSGYSVWWTVPG